jgi:hypothetical protein
MNGGDGFVVTRRLAARAQALLLGRRDDVTGDARHHLQECERAAPGRVTEVAAAEAWKGALARIEAADLVVDAVLGTGLRSAPNGLAALAIEAMRARLDAGVPSWRWTCRRACRRTRGPRLGGRGRDLDRDLRRAEARARAAAGLRRGRRARGADIGIPSASVASAQPSLFLIEDRDAALAPFRGGPGARTRATSATC